MSGFELSLPFNQSIFITGIGTDIGKTWVSILWAKIFHYKYWKPIQSGVDVEGYSDTMWVQKNNICCATDVLYEFKEPLSPHFLAQKKDIDISIETIVHAFQKIENYQQSIIVEGVGGLLSPINNESLNIDLIRSLKLPIVLVSRKYLGSINHSLLTAEVALKNNLPIVGWVLNGYEKEDIQEIINWSTIPCLFSIPMMNKNNIHEIDIVLNDIRQQVIKMQ